MVRVGFFQFDPVFGDKERNIDHVLRALERVEADLMVLPELFVSGYQFASRKEVAELSEPVPDGQTTDALAGLSRKKNMWIVAGLPEKDKERYYNSAVLTGPQGYVGCYRKTHLFFEEKLWFSPGNTGFQVFATDIGCIGTMICFDWIFPESMRTLALMRAEIIAHPANLVLPYCPSAMPVRCLENRVFAITANRVGREERREGPPLAFIGTSQVVGPDAAILARAPETGEALMILEIEPKKAREKSINPLNDLFQDRRPELYFPCGGEARHGSRPARKEKPRSRRRSAGQ